jgi:hypothetical protein
MSNFATSYGSASHSSVEEWSLPAGLIVLILAGFP